MARSSSFGILSVKGVAIVLLCGLFIGGLLYPLQFINGYSGQAKESVSTNQVSVDSNAPSNNSLHLSAGSMTVIPEMNIGVKLSAGDNFEKKSREVRLSFSFPKNPMGKITEQNKVDESVVSIQGQWIRPNIDQIISLGEIGRFAITATNHAFNEMHDSVTSLDLSISRIEK